MQRIETKIYSLGDRKIMRKLSFLSFRTLIIVFLRSKLNLFTDLFFNSKVILLDKIRQNIYKEPFQNFHLRNTEWVTNIKCFSFKPESELLWTKAFNVKQRIEF